MSRFSNERFHPGSKNYESDQKAREYARQQGLKAGNGSLSVSEANKAAREGLMKRLEEGKRLRALFKGSAAKKALDKHKQ